MAAYEKVLAEGTDAALAEECAALFPEHSLRAGLANSDCVVWVAEHSLHKYIGIGDTFY